MNIKIKVLKLHPKATLPKFQSKQAIGADLYTLDNEIEYIIEPHSTVFIPTGLAIEIPSGYGGFIFARSGIATKDGLAPANKVGIIDSDYRGEIIVAIHNHSCESVLVLPSQRIAQLVILPCPKIECIEVNSLSATERGDGKFGSTGKF